MSKTHLSSMSIRNIKSGYIQDVDNAQTVEEMVEAFKKNIPELNQLRQL